MRRTIQGVMTSLVLAVSAMGQVPQASSITTTNPTPGLTQQLAQISAPALDLPIGPRDILDIRVLQDPTLNTRTVVGDDGKITFGLIGKVDLAGLIVQQVEVRIKTKLEA